MTTASAGKTHFAAARRLGISARDNHLQRPSALKSWAVARPMPVVPPVMRMVLIFMSFGFVLYFRTSELMDKMSSPCYKKGIRPLTIHLSTTSRRVGAIDRATSRRFSL